MHVIQQDDEAVAEHTDHTHERVDDERAEEHENEAPHQHHPRSARRRPRAAPRRRRRPERNLDDPQDGARHGRQRAPRSNALPLAAQAQAQAHRRPVDDERQREEAGAEEVRERDEAGVQEAGAEQEGEGEGQHAAGDVRDDGAVLQAEAGQRAVEEQHALVADLHRVKQREGGGRQLLVGEQQREHQPHRQLTRARVGWRPPVAGGVSAAPTPGVRLADAVGEREVQPDVRNERGDEQQPSRRGESR